MNLDDFRQEDCEMTFATLLSAIVFEEQVNEAPDISKLLGQSHRSWHCCDRTV